MNPSFTARATASPDVLYRVVGNEAVLLNLKTEVYLGLDAVGTRMWAMLTTAPSIERAYELLLQEYDVEPARLKGDLTEFLEKLVSQKLIEFDCD